MVRSSSSSSFVRLEHLEDGVPLLCHQHALAHVFTSRSSASQNLPTQLVYPNSSMAIGFPPTSLNGLFAPNEVESGETEEERQNRLRQGYVVVYASETEDAKIRPILQQWALALIVCVVSQAICIAVIFAGGSWLPVTSPSSEKSHMSIAGRGGVHSRQEVIYSGILVSHVLPLFAVLYRYPVVLALYSTLTVVVFFLGLLLSIYSALDVIILAFCLVIRYITSEIKFYMMPHAFAVPPA